VAQQRIVRVQPRFGNSQRPDDVRRERRERLRRNLRLTVSCQRQANAQRRVAAHCIPKRAVDPGRRQVEPKLARRGC
jgi:hypothetical protein